MSVNSIGNNLSVRAEFQKTPVVKAEQKAEVPVRLTNLNDGGGTSVNLSEAASSKNLISSDLQGKMKLAQSLGSADGASANIKQLGGMREVLGGVQDQLGRARDAIGRRPRSVGDIPRVFGQPLNNFERQFIDQHPALLVPYGLAEREALNFEAAMRGASDTHIDDDPINAIKHAYWSAQMTQASIGVQRASSPSPYPPPVSRDDISRAAGEARAFGLAHEKNDTSGQNIQHQMDLYNNRVGRIIAMDNPNASRAEFRQLMVNAAKDGKLVCIDNGRMRYTNQVRFTIRSMN